MESKTDVHLGTEDCWEIVNGSEVEPSVIQLLSGENISVANQRAVDLRAAEIKDFRKRSKKAASLITLTLDDSLVMSLDVHERNPVLMWNQLAADYNTITPLQRSTARKEFLSFVIYEEETHLEIKQRYNELLRQVTVQGGKIDAEDRLETLLNALPLKYDAMREAYYGLSPPPGIEYVWNRMYDHEATEKRRAIQSGASAMAADTYYVSRGGGSIRNRGRGRSGGSRVGGGVEKKCGYESGEGMQKVEYW